MLYRQTRPNPEFRRRAEELSAESFRRVADVLLPCRDEMTHPDPEAAIRFGLMVIASTLRVVVLSDRPWKMLGIPEDRLGDELTRVFLGYLGAAPAREPATGRPRRALRRQPQRE